jgi:uroporphyrin-III C-methyltransferase
MKSPKLTLVGAGPGDPGLITMKGIQALRTADVVLFDALANPLLLEHAPSEARKIFVGKRKDLHSYTQEEINTMITSLAFKYGHVVRLKGGDPFVLGRGMEEIEVARAIGIETDYVPGVSSALSVPGLVGIPLTHREISKSVWIVSGVSASGAITEDLRHAARSSGTVVILMGLTTLKDIVRIFTEEERTERPVAVIQNGSLENQQAVAGTISTIESAVAESQIGAPAIIVIGDVVKFFHNKRNEASEAVVREQQDQL